MTKLPLYAAALSVLLPATAFAANMVTTLTPEAETQIRTTLTEQGYEVRKIKIENGLYEAYVLRDGSREEINLDADMHLVDGKSDD